MNVLNIKFHTKLVDEKRVSQVDETQLANNGDQLFVDFGDENPEVMKITYDKDTLNIFCADRKDLWE